jgi:acyl dehydratase
VSFHATLPWSTISKGLELEPLAFEVSYSTLARHVVGTRDLLRMHHDPPFAMEVGAPNIFLNTMWYQGFIGRYITDWAGYDTFLRKLTIKMRVHGCPGDTLTIFGTVVEVTELNENLLVDLDIRIDNGAKTAAVVATARVELTPP